MSDLEKLTIREAMEKDFPRWILMRKKLWPTSSYDELKDVDHLYKSEKFTCFIAEIESTLIGFMELSIRPYVNGCDSSPVAFIEGIWVDEKWQKRGIGNLFVKKAEEWARNLAIRELASDTRIESLASIHAHNTWGFVETERVVYFKKDLQP